ncbi:MAG TPA: ATP-grasp domain-containing protein, partial [Methylomicrobium sp.]|nr:ATP-grasp domain-containing protein [Methylomicrobium sp.]
MNKHSEYLLIIASSGRMLSEAARKAGLKALVIDLYADLDTRHFALGVRRVLSLAVEHVAPALDELIGRYGVDQFIYGSGLEDHLETLGYLDTRMTVLGNDPDVFRRVQNKGDFFAVLSELKISFPQVSFNAPETACDWLIKPIRGAGGAGVCRYDSGRKVPENVYWQRFQAGTPCSALFLANARDVRVIGFNTQFTVQMSDGLEFAFCGLINHSNLSRGLQSLISDWLEQCVQSFALKGLNSLDFIHDGEQVYVLEINPRPSASMQLYGNLLALHVDACRGVLPDTLPEQRGFAGFLVLYTDANLYIPNDFDWPAWVRDRPEAGELCKPGQPVCSIIAGRKDPQEVWDVLAARRKHIFNQLTK